MKEGCLSLFPNISFLLFLAARTMQTTPGRASTMHLHGCGFACNSRRPVPWSPRGRRCFHVAQVAAPVVPEPAPEGFENRASPHPDAVRRRREAEARRKQRMRDLAEISAHIAGRSTSQPPNMMNIDCASEFDFRVASGSRGDHKVVVHFKSPWCQSCVRLQPKLRRVARENPDIPFLLVDASDATLREMCQKHGIDKIPYFQVYQNGGMVMEGQWSEIDLLRKSSTVDIESPMCTLSARQPEDSHSGHWKKVMKIGDHGKMEHKGLGALDLLVHSSALEWVPLEDEQDTHFKKE